MNIFQTVNTALTLAVIGAAVKAVAIVADSGSDRSGLPSDFDAAAFWLLVVFLVLLKIKTWMDDHKHFGEEVQDKLTLRYIGFILSIFSLGAWGVAAWIAPNVSGAALWLAIALIISTMWIVAHIVEILLDSERRNSEVFVSVMREKWVLLNLFYIGFLILYINGLPGVLAPLNYWTLAAIYPFFLFDILTSRSFKGILNQ